MTSFLLLLIALKRMRSQMGLTAALLAAMISKARPRCPISFD